MLRWGLHYGIHFLLPIIIGLLFYREHRSKAIIILLGGILIDIDHLWADPIFESGRCSINFHPLHTYGAIACYFVLLFPKRTRIFGIALLIHILADLTDCLLM
ncbi:MAG TPA: DUF6122 family protein [Arenibacter sp.]|nr:DUF6122 family protein [Arenibacter sp.]